MTYETTVYRSRTTAAHVSRLFPLVAALALTLFVLLSLVIPLGERLWATVRAVLVEA